MSEPVLRLSVSPVETWQTVGYMRTTVLISELCLLFGCLRCVARGTKLTVVSRVDQQDFQRWLCSTTLVSSYWTTSTFSITPSSLASCCGALSEHREYIHGCEVQLTPETTSSLCVLLRRTAQFQVSVHGVWLTQAHLRVSSPRLVRVPLQSILLSRLWVADMQ